MSTGRPQPVTSSVCGFGPWTTVPRVTSQDYRRHPLLSAPSGKVTPSPSSTPSLDLVSWTGTTTARCTSTIGTTTPAASLSGVVQTRRGREDKGGGLVSVGHPADVRGMSAPVPAALRRTSASRHAETARTLRGPRQDHPTDIRSLSAASPQLPYRTLQHLPFLTKRAHRSARSMDGLRSWRGRINSTWCSLDSLRATGLQLSEGAGSFRSSRRCVVTSASC